MKTKSFYDEENRETFREEYAAMALHEKAMENPALAVAGILAVVTFGLVVVDAVGLV
ncbi:restriction endonuclease [Natrarchaeobaculum sulfurireducens]|uniref:Restriction endonuclease n=1 Tax=Natrarchaeobaculum sulfurireducens TaxID=2044521 RepID=A0A346PAL6_9EURY|nr:Restriction endonuclease [Natrarchaeobaculum sulfurireducens]AXR80238.1 restriction endonuclease [Natrarchaeobaculum sulfurireducens]